MKAALKIRGSLHYENGFKTWKNPQYCQIFIEQKPNLSSPTTPPQFSCLECDATPEFLENLHCCAVNDRSRPKTNMASSGRSICSLRYAPRSVFAQTHLALE
jgi:hypothetical protein